MAIQHAIMDKAAVCGEDARHTEGTVRRGTDAMGLRTQLDLLFDTFLQILATNGLILLIAAVALALLLTFGVGLRRRRAGSPDALAASAAPATDDRDSFDDIAPTEDRILPLGRTGFLVLVIVLAAGAWCLGFALASDRHLFLASREWQFQPFYIAVHLVTLRLFVALFTRNYRLGIARLDAPEEAALAGMHRILGAWGALCALVVALPFCLSDFRYLHGARYEKLDPTRPLQAIDYVMWGIWSAEWFLNAFIWVILIGFLVRNVRTLTSYRFLAPIEVVLSQKHYRPFLRMSSQGASVVLMFGLMTVIYITYTGGAITDYLGLAITATLLIIGFLVPWLMLRRKVRLAVEQEQLRLQGAVLQFHSNPGALALLDSEPMMVAGRTPVAQAAAFDLSELRRLSDRLDYVVSHLRVAQLERLHVGLGATEARAVAIRLLAPAATIAWQVSQNHKSLLEQLNRLLQPLIARLGALAG